MKFSQKILRIGDFEKLSFFDFESAILEKLLGYQGWVEILMIILVSSQKSLNTNISAPSVHKPNLSIPFSLCMRLLKRFVLTTLLTVCDTVICPDPIAEKGVAHIIALGGGVGGTVVLKWILCGYFKPQQYKYIVSEVIFIRFW